MAIPTSANYVFLPWVRQGAASGIQTPDSLDANQAGVVSVPVKLRVNNTDDIDRQVRLHGPGDVTGIDPQQVVRTDPRHQATDFEPNYFPAIEFDRPDFPWLFTPAQANADGKLRPWLCLVVVRKQDGVTLRADRNLPLPVLEILRPEHELPDLSDSWAWAHAQVAGSTAKCRFTETIAGGRPCADGVAVVVSAPARSTDRVSGLCGARVRTGTQSGPGFTGSTRGRKRIETFLDGSTAISQSRCPSISTGSFAPARAVISKRWWELLEARDSRDLPAEVGKRQMDISQPGFRTTPPLPSGTVLDLEGALCRLEATAAEWPDETRTLFQGELKKILDAPAQAMSEEGADPLLAPPIYGCWQAARHTVDMTPAPPASVTWLDELNLDPRHRSIAALGTAVVQTQQEPLMASAWEQLGEIERINQMQRLAQLGRAVNAVFYARHFSRFSEETLLKVVGAAQSRIVVESAGANTRMLLSQRLSQSAIPAKAISAPLRRLTSPRGVISTRFRHEWSAAHRHRDQVKRRFRRPAS